MTENELEDLTHDVAAVLKALEPWLRQLLRANPEEKFLAPKRLCAAADLVDIFVAAREK